MKLGVNLGSGQRPFTSMKDVKWINVDKVAHVGMPEPDLLCDGAHLPNSANSVDYVVLHHVLEHFGCGEGDGLVREAQRVLKLGGSLFIFVPDIRALSGRWLGGQLETQIYLTNLYGAYMGHEEDRHKWGFDGDSLYELLKRCGRWDVKWFDWREVPGMDAAHDWWVLAFEAVKG